MYIKHFYFNEKKKPLCVFIYNTYFIELRIYFKQYGL